MIKTTCKPESIRPVFAVQRRDGARWVMVLEVMGDAVLAELGPLATQGEVDEAIATARDVWNAR